MGNISGRIRLKFSKEMLFFRKIAFLLALRTKVSLIERGRRGLNRDYSRVKILSTDTIAWSDGIGTADDTD